MAIPPGKVSTYGALAKSLSSSPRAVGGALRNNPYAPEVPCHRVIASDSFVGGFKGDWEKAPSGINQALKLELLKDEGVQFSQEGKLLDKEAWFMGPFDIEKAKPDLKAAIKEHGKKR
jgi:methylated-DNA-[protein]-cysteine S-methyltransferase